MLDEQITKHFIGHTKELEIFEQWLTRSDDPWILFFHDATNVPAKKGGIGKTWLLRKCARIAKEQHKNIAIAVIDFFSVVDRDGVEVARCIVESLQEAYPDWSPDLFTEALAEYDEAIRAQKNLNEFRDKLHTTLTSDLKILEKLLVGSNWQLIVFFDTYEVIETYPTAATLSSISLFPDRYQCKQMRVVIAGRNTPDWEHTNWRGHRQEEVRCVPIDPFSHDEMVQFLNENINVMGPMEVQSPEAQVLHTSTEGRPILVGLVTDMLNNRVMTLNELLVIPQDRFESYLVEQINNLANPINWVVLFMAHIYHRFDEKLLIWLFEHLLSVKELVQDLPEPGELFRNLLQFSFVRRSGSGDHLALHDEMRRLVNQYNWKTLGSQTGLYRRELSQSVISYYEHEIAGESNELLRRTYMVEMLYHQLYVDIQEGFETFDEHFARALNLWQKAFARSLLQEAKKFQDRFSRRQKSRLMLREADLLYKEADRPGALELYHQLEQQADEDWLEIYRAKIWFEKGSCYVQTSQLPEAITCLTKALEIATAQNNEPRLALVLGVLGRCYHRQGDLNTAADCYEKSIAIHKKLGNQRGYADVLNIISALYRLQGKTDEALRRCQIALNIRKKLYEQGKGSEYAIGWSLENMGVIHLKVDDLINAQKFFQQAYEIHERNKHRKGLAVIYNRFGQVAMAKNELAEAAQWFEKAYHAALGIDEEAVINSLNKQGWVLVLQGQLEEAIPLLTKAIERALQVNDYYQQAESLIDLADVLERLKRHQESYGMLQEAEAISRERNFNYLLGIAEDFRGENKYNEGDYTAAFKHFGESCYYMALYNPIQYRKAVRKTTSLLLDVPKELIPQLLETLSTDWLSHQLEEERDSLMLNALAEIQALIDV